MRRRRKRFSRATIVISNMAIRTPFTATSAPYTFAG